MPYVRIHYCCQKPKIILLYFSPKMETCIFFFYRTVLRWNQVQLSLNASQSHFLTANKIKQVFELLYEANSINIFSAILLVFL